MARFLLFIEEGSVHSTSTEFVGVRALGMTEVADEFWQPSPEMVDLAALYGLSLALYNPSDPADEIFNYADDPWFLDQGKILYDNLARRLLAKYN